MKVLFLLLCALIGGGIATGREVFVFFYRFGSIGLAFLILSSILLAMTLYFLYKKCRKEKIVSFQQLNNKLFPRTNGIIFVIYNICLVITCATMLSGYQSLFDDFWAVSFPFESILLMLVCLILLHKGIDYIAKASLPISVVMVVVLVLSCVFNLPTIRLSNFYANSGGAVIYGGLFVASNFMLLVSLVLSLNIKKSRATFISFGISVVLVLSLRYLALASNKVVPDSEMPLIYLPNSTTSSLIYVISIMFAMVTTLITSLYALNNNMATIFGSEKKSALICSLVIYILSMMSFGSLVKYGFPAMGAIGAIFLIRSLIFAFDKRKN